jgi:hypothetical protein
MLQKIPVSLTFDGMRRFHLSLPLLLAVPPLFAVDPTWVRQTYADRETTNFGLATPNFRLEAQVVDLNTSSFQCRQGPEYFRAVLTKPLTFGWEFQAELLGARKQEGEEFANVSSFLRHRHRPFSLGPATLSLHSQVFTGNRETRPAVGLPLDLTLGARSKAGVSGMVEHGKFGGDGADRYAKFIVNLYFQRHLLSNLTGNLGFYTEQVRELGLRTETANGALQYQLSRDTKINLSTGATRTPDGIVYNQLLGTTIIF